MSDPFGFFISELRLKGTGLDDATVPFSRGLSVVAGPSDTGKSLVRDAINFVFGASIPLKGIQERGKYDRVLVEIQSYTGTVLTFERAWNGGDVLLYQAPASSVVDSTASQLLAWKHDPNSTETVSPVLLELSGLAEYRLRRNLRGETRSISFRDLVEYVLISEERIITIFSPIHSGQYIDKTVESSVFRALLTGVDDAAISALPRTETLRVETEAKKELFEQLRTELQTRIQSLGQSEGDLLRSAEAIDSQVDQQSEALRAFNADTANLETQRAELWRQRKRASFRRQQIGSLLAKFDLLDRKYNSDLERLLSNLEAGTLLVDLHEGPCPLCGADPKDHRHDVLVSQEELELFTIACNAEAQKIHGLQADLASTVVKLSAEASQIDEAIPVIEDDLRGIISALKAVVQPNISSLRTGLSGLIQSRREVERALGVSAELRRLEELQVSLNEPDTTQPSERQQFATVPPSAYESCAKSVEELLRAWAYPELDRVVFDASKEDLVISGKARADHGKGYRAITYAAFMVAVMKEAHRLGLPHPGFVVLDSPLVTYREPTETIGEGLKSAFYRDLSQLGEFMQVVILENIDPPEDLLGAMTHTEFTKSRTAGRYGLLPAIEA